MTDPTQWNLDSAAQIDWKYHYCYLCHCRVAHATTGEVIVEYESTTYANHYTNVANWFICKKCQHKRALKKLKQGAQ